LVDVQPPHVQLPEQTSWPQSSSGEHARVAPGAHVPPPLHVVHPPYAPHTQPIVVSQLRVRDCVPVPQLPHACVCVSVCPGVHTPEPPPMHMLHAVHGPHTQPIDSSQLRECVCVPVPHVPHPCIAVSVVPGTHTPCSPPHPHAPHVQSFWHWRVC
jgi:hypothetical protein